MAGIEQVYPPVLAVRLIAGFLDLPSIASASLCCREWVIPVREGLSNVHVAASNAVGFSPCIKHYGAYPPWMASHALAFALIPTCNPMYLMTFILSGTMYAVQLFIRAQPVTSLRKNVG